MKGQNLFDTFGKSLKLPVTNVTGPHRDVMSCRFLSSTATFHCNSIQRDGKLLIFYWLPV